MVSARILFSFVVLGALLLVACSTEGAPATNPTPPASAESVSPTASVAEDTVTPAGSSGGHPASTPTSSETQTPQVGLVFFLRPPEKPWAPGTDYWDQLGRGDLWMANADGSGEQQVTFGKANVTFAGFLTTEDGPTLYYTSGDGTTFDLWRRVWETGAETKLLSFNGWPDWVGAQPIWATLAAVRPDGRYAALVEADNIVLADLATGERRTLFKTNRPDCKETDIVSCFSYSQPRWSPDGSLLAVQHTGWEWKGDFIVDPLEPFAQPAAHGPFGIPYVPGGIEWRTPDEACTKASAYDPGGLYLIHGPDWALDLSQAEDISGYCPDSGEKFSGHVAQCMWLDDRRIAFLAVLLRPDTSSRIEVIDVDTRETRTLAEFTHEDGAAQASDMFALRGEGLIVYNSLHHEQFMTASLIRVADGSNQPILRERDHVIALVPALGGD
jgi:hypothetical protein